MIELRTLALIGLAGVVLAGCGGNRGVFGRAGPDEFVVARRAPLVIPPDFALTPPKPGAPRPQEADSSTQALNALFGGTAGRSAGETAVLDQAGRSEPGIRSEAADNDTDVVNKGQVTKDIVAAPATANPQANASTGQ